MNDETQIAPVERDPMDAVKAVEGPRDNAAAGGEPPISPEMPDADAGFLTGARSPGHERDALSPDPEYGDFAWPDGFAADPGALGKFLPIAKKLGLDKEGAQELASLYADLHQERDREQARFIAGKNQEWREEIRSHPEFGGRHLDATSAAVASTMRRYGSPLLMEQIRQMNVQNWPEMFYFLARVSRAASEDCSPLGGAQPGGGLSTAKLLFPGLK